MAESDSRDQEDDQQQGEEIRKEVDNQDESANPPAVDGQAKPAKKRANQGDTNKKRKKTKKWAKNSVVDKNKLTMFDLISYNPPAIDPLGELNEDEDKPTDEEPSEEDKEPNEEPLIEDSKADEMDDEEEKIGPRVKINESGDIVLDEESLIVKRKKPKDQNIKTVYEDDRIISTRTNYSSFKKPGEKIGLFTFKDPSILDLYHMDYSPTINLTHRFLFTGKASEKKLRWTDDETVKFYTALTIIGTDFTLMSDLFFRDTRSRVDLKNKFKQEEKFHKVLIDNALKKSDLTSIQDLEQLNFDMFSSESEPEEAVDSTENAAEEAATAT